MSVKFQQETVKDAPIPGSRKEDIAHNIGERLTGGETAQGYLAVSPIETMVANARRLTKALDLPSAAPEQPSPHKDAHIWLIGGSPRSSCVMDREGCQQTWPLHQLSRAQDGCIRCLHQRTSGALPDPHPTKGVLGKN